MKKNNIIIFICIIILISLIVFLIINNKNNTNYNSDLTKITFNETKDLIDNKEDFVIILSQSTCSHCEDYKPKAKMLAKKYNITIYYLDYDIDTEDKDKILEYFNYDGGTPTTFFFKKGKETSIMERIVGDVEKSVLENKLKKLEYITTDKK